MADLEFDEFEGEYGPNGYSSTGYGVPDVRLDRAKRLVNMSGALCSVALVLGLGLWGYQLAVRDVAGVPVMRALIGPMRVAPVDPGGDQASHQGLSVNAIAATGTAAPVSEQLTLAPRATELQPDDGTGLQASVGSDEEAASLLQANLQVTGTTTTTTTGTPASLQVDGPAPLGDGAGTHGGPRLGDLGLASVGRGWKSRNKPSALSFTGRFDAPMFVEADKFSSVASTSSCSLNINPGTSNHRCPREEF